MTENAVGRWPALQPVGNADATVAAPRVSQRASMFEVVVACAECGLRQGLWGTVQEIGAAAEVWKQGHQCAARLGESGSAALTDRNPSICQASANAGEN
jgi:hypothetical protein